MKKYEAQKLIKKGQILINDSYDFLKEIEETDKCDLGLANYPKTMIEGDKKLTIVFTGQYSAGKSTILKMLTGRKDIKTGSGITTQKTQTFDWDGVEVIDTPGIHTTLRPDHDEISYNAISKADMLVFVITNELFDNYMAGHFRKLAIDEDKAKEMVLVVNKMARANEGNSVKQQNILRKDLEKVLYPSTPEEVNLCFIDAESYLDSLDEVDVEMKEELIKESGYESFINTLNIFTRKKGISASMTTPVYRMIEILKKALKVIMPSSGDADLDALEEQFTQQCEVWEEARNEVKVVINNIYKRGADKIEKIGRDVASNIGNLSDAEAQNVLETAAETINKIESECNEKAIKAINEVSLKAGKELKEIYKSDLTKTLIERLSVRCKTNSALPQENDSVLKEYLPTIGEQLAKIDKEKVIDLWHFVGGKFKPWGAVKATKIINAGGMAIPLVSTLLDIYTEHKQDVAEREYAAALKKQRDDLKMKFNQVAGDLETEGVKKCEEYINEMFNKNIKRVESNINTIRKTKSNANLRCQKLQEYINAANNIIKELHSI